MISILSSFYTKNFKSVELEIKLMERKKYEVQVAFNNQVKVYHVSTDYIRNSDSGSIVFENDYYNRYLIIQFPAAHSIVKLIGTINNLTSSDTELWNNYFIEII
jgi:hypothetical protein